MAQLASASGLGPEGPVFESQYPDIQQKPAENQQVFFFLRGGDLDITAHRENPVFVIEQS